MKLYLRFILSLFLAFTSCQPAFALTKVDGSLLKGDVIGGTASDTRRIVVPKDTKANLDAKTRLEANLVYGTDTKKAYIDNGTDLVAVGSGSGGAVNLITDGDAENATSSIFVPYKDAAASRPVDGVGSSADVTTAITSTAPLTGAKSFTITKDAANRQGQGWSIPFTVPLSMQAKVLQIEVDYIVNSGTFVAGTSSTDSDVIWYLYDITNSQLIEPSSIKLLSSSSTLSDKFRSTFQTSATGTSYRLIAHVASTSAAAYELKVETSVSPSVYVYGTPISDWVSWTPTGSWTTNTTYTGKWRRVGDLKEYQYDLALTGTPTATNLSLNLPSGDVIDTSKLVSASVGVSHIPNSGGKAFDGVSAVHNLALVYGGTTAVRATYESTATGQIANVTQAAPFTFNSGDTIQVSFAVPIVGLSSSVQMSDQTDTRIVAASYYGHNSPTFADNTYTTIQFNTKLEDTHAMFSAGTTTIKVAGLYEINAAAAFVIGGYGANNIFNLRVRVNGATDYSLDRLIYTTSVQPNVTKGSIRLPLKAGDTIVIQAMKTNFGGNSGFDPDLTQTRMSIVRVSGPSAIAATESINLRYTTVAGQTINNTAPVVIFGTKVYDSHSAFNSTTGVFTAPIAGKYRVSAKLTSTATAFTVGQDFECLLFKNGSAYSELGRSWGNAASINLHTGGSDTVDMLAGQTLSIVGYSNTTTTLVTNANLNYITIERVGN